MAATILFCGREVFAVIKTLSTESKTLDLFNKYTRYVVKKSVLVWRQRLNTTTFRFSLNDRVLFTNSDGATVLDKFLGENNDIRIL